MLLNLSKKVNEEGEEKENLKIKKENNEMSEGVNEKNNLHQEG